MDQKSLYFRIGSAILGGLAGLLALLVWIGSDTFRRRGIMMETYFGETVQGLEVGAQVKFRGVTIGAVRQISVAAAEYPQAVGETLATDPSLRLVVVRFELIRERVAGSDGRDFREMVDAGLRMRMASQGITGIVYLEADFVDPARFQVLRPRWEPAYPYIPSVPSTLTQFQTAAEQLMARLNDVDVGGLVQRTDALVTALTEAVSSGEGYRLLVEAADAAAELRTAVHRIAPALEATAAEAGAATKALREIMEGREMRAIVTNTAAATAELRAALARLPATLATADQTVRRIDALASDADRDLGPILRDLRAMADNLRALTEQMRRYPSQALFGQPPPGGPAEEPRP
ncbi:MCE family protein [Elioraea sp. Yellowstone]|jgi:paraquat-inducible protein B|uniref:MlaD family protein n=1 Tax=Elioraea sp. Yellowstone TaxID=2592070 RepID=UPI00115215C9|nr:MlaD family protein [Elioraea sp. Yellowstone]TQF84474.1 MCE family protein [Elioraea sp. Yellowstone]